MRLPFKAVAIATILSSCGAAIVSAQKDSDPVLKKVGAYRQWIRVTPAPLPVKIAATEDSPDYFSGG